MTTPLSPAALAKELMELVDLAAAGGPRDHFALSKFVRNNAEAIARALTDYGVQFERNLIIGFPWSDDDPDEALKKCELAEAEGLLVLEDTEPGSMEEYEYGPTMYRLTDKGLAALPHRPQGE